MARNKQIAPHVGRLSRSRVNARRGLYKGLKTSQPPPKIESEPFKTVQVGGEKNGATRLLPTHKAAAFYPAEDSRQPKRSRKSPKPPALRRSITCGTVLILLAGRFRGKRVVFLKQLASGLLLVTGPYTINGVPLRRVNQAYVIATSTKVDLGDYKVDNVDDAYFAKQSVSRPRDAESEFFADGKPKEKEPYPEKKALEQKNIDKVVIEAVKTAENMSKYLKASWGLSKGQYPHQLVF